MSIVRRLAAGCYWISQDMQGTSAIRRRTAMLERTQRWEPERLRALQLDKLRRLVGHAYATTSYYRELMDGCDLHPRDVVDFATFARLPLLTRDLLHERGADLVSRAAPAAGMHARHSSGSTGLRVEVRQDREFDMWCRAHQLRTYAWCGGWRLGDPFVLVWGSPMLFETRTAAQRRDSRLSRRTEIEAFRLDRASVDRMLDGIARARPRLVSGYTTALYVLAQRALERGLDIPSVRAVQPTAEPLSSAMRSTIGKGFDCDVFDKYGSRETSIVAHESPFHEGMCIQAEHTYVEFLAADGRAAAPGQPGRLVLTTLNNLAQPLLRYETTDVAAPLEGRCRSGVGLPLMTAVDGRLHDVISAPDGGLVHPQLFSNVLRQFPQVRWFQVVQREAARLTLRIVTSDGPLTPSVRRQIGVLINEHTGFPYAIAFEQLDDMPAASTATGKYRVCVSTVGGAASALGELNRLRAWGPS